ncbi:hypothetical protein CW696_02580 [ANME-2 cluster archaeon]|nr:MAG: hypothetical protein CW696_02580 [ANME-2 cluster archaeon]
MSISLATHGIITPPGSGGESGGGWTPSEKEQIRDALGIDGTKTKSTGGVLQRRKRIEDAILAAVC